MRLDNQLWEELKRIINLVNTSDIGRMGKLFSTEKNNYFYDTGTGKVIELDDEDYYMPYEQSCESFSNKERQNRRCI